VRALVDAADAALYAAKASGRDRAVLARPSAGPAGREPGGGEPQRKDRRDRTPAGRS